ncbi:hypothetical protein EDD18DRAFT_1332275 [Armillaria luteobubalina]|uniref:Uncharacterized protein n=1 Tax=Armillaria luteobubalina TaxID=153913 RepID=A0AA39Q5V2_9AGAR|nr:hypothetical protein EDD18DRAFT_1332275 [Armillaria luteobubalina]
MARADANLNRDAEPPRGVRLVRCSVFGQKGRGADPRGNPSQEEWDRREALRKEWKVDLPIIGWIMRIHPTRPTLNKWRYTARMAPDLLAKLEDEQEDSLRSNENSLQDDISNSGEEGATTHNRGGRKSADHPPPRYAQSSEDVDEEELDDICDDDDAEFPENGVCAYEPRLSISTIYRVHLKLKLSKGGCYVLVGISSTLLMGCTMAGHRARPDDSWHGSVVVSASIMSRSQEHSQTSFKEEDWSSPVLDGDLEAQRESSVRGSSLYEDTTHSSTVVDEGTS